jgi:putative oxidoreductase
MIRLALVIRSFVVKVSGKLTWLPPTLTRLCVGWVFLQTGWGKLHKLPDIIEYFRSLGIPAPQIQAPFASATELVCGGLILVGLFTRIASVPLIVTMAVAIATAKKDDLNGLGDLYGFTEYLYILLFGYLAAFGAGPLSLDHILYKRVVEPHEAADGTPETLARKAS